MENSGVVGPAAPYVGATMWVGPLLKSADKDELIVSSSHFEVSVATALARADQGQVACALEMERALHS